MITIEEQPNCLIPEQKYCVDNRAGQQFFFGSLQRVFDWVAENRPGEKVFVCVGPLRDEVVFRDLLTRYSARS